MLQFCRIARFSRSASGLRLVMAPHCVEGDHGSAQRQSVQQLGDGCNFVGLCIDPSLRQHEVVGTGPGRNHVHPCRFSRLARAA